MGGEVQGAAVSLSKSGFMDENRYVFFAPEPDSSCRLSVGREEFLCFYRVAGMK